MVLAGVAFPLSFPSFLSLPLLLLVFCLILPSRRTTTWIVLSAIYQAVWLVGSYIAQVVANELSPVCCAGEPPISVGAGGGVGKADDGSTSKNEGLACVDRASLSRFVERK